MIITLIVIIGLSLIILSHEAGHYIAARIFKLKIHEFGFGFPPRMASFRRYTDSTGRKKWVFRFGSQDCPDEIDGKVGDETSYSLNWLPLGGFVRIAGENDHMDDEGNIDATAIPESEKNRLLSAQRAWKKIVVMIAGVTVNFITGWLLVSAIFMMGTPRALMVSGVADGSPAAEAGIKEGDVIKNFVKSEDFIPFVANHQDEKVQLSIVRNGAQKDISVTPAWNEELRRATIGVSLVNAGIEKEGFFSSFGSGLTQSYEIAKMTFVGFAQLLGKIVTKGQIEKGVVGPIGIFAVAQQTGALGLVYLFQLLAVIAINLAAINLIPFPALDGGRVLFALIEKAKGSPLPRKAEIIANMTGFFLLIGLMIVITIRDVASRWF